MYLFFHSFYQPCNDVSQSYMSHQHYREKKIKIRNKTHVYTELHIKKKLFHLKDN